jgi:hypothetical protein
MDRQINIMLPNCVKLQPINNTMQVLLMIADPTSQRDKCALSNMPWPNAAFFGFFCCCCSEAQLFGR